MRGLGAEPSFHLGFYHMGKGIMSFWVGSNDIHPSSGSKGLREAMDFHLESWGRQQRWGCAVLSPNPHTGELHT